MKRSALGQAALRIGDAALSGYGLSAGRDIWKFTRNRGGYLLLLVIFASAVALPFLGGRNLTRGYPRGAFSQTLWGHLSGFILIALGLLFAGCLFAVGLAFIDSSARLSTAETQGLAAIIVSAIVGVPLILGLLFGLIQRRRRRSSFATAEKNRVFLDSLGFVETGEKEITHYDGAGNPLRIEEVTDSSIVFVAVGKRNRRAYIELNSAGEMIDYTGVVAIDAKRKRSGSN